ncbi:MAG: tetratricopeptide repeat protein [candidate division Zixibacteria bacterium]
MGILDWIKTPIEVITWIKGYSKKKARQQALEDFGHDPDDADPPDRHDLNVAEKHLSDDHSDLKKDIQSLRGEIRSLREKDPPKTISAGEQLAPIKPEPKIKEEAQSLLARLDKLKQSGEELPLSLGLDEGMALVSGGEYDKAIEKIDDYLGKIEDAAVQMQARVDEERFLALSAKGDAYYNKPEYKKALASYMDANKLKPDYPGILNNIGMCNIQEAKYEQAKSNLEEAANIESRINGEKTTDYAIFINNIGTILKELGDYDASLKYYQKALRLFSAIYDEQHSYIAGVYNNIGSTLYHKQDYNEALENHYKALQIDLEIREESPPDIARDYSNIGTTLIYLGDSIGALDNFRKALKIYMEVFEENHPAIATVYNGMGLALKNKRESKKALEYYQKALKINTDVFGEYHPMVARVFNNIAHLYHSIGKLVEGLPYIIKTYKTRFKFLGPDHPDTKNSKLGIEMCGGDPDAVEREVREEMEREAKDNPKK